MEAFKAYYRVDPEKVRQLDNIWRPLWVLFNVPRAEGWNRNPQDFVDAGYCIDRYISGEPE